MQYQKEVRFTNSHINKVVGVSMVKSGLAWGYKLLLSLSASAIRLQFQVPTWLQLSKQLLGKGELNSFNNIQI